MARDIVHTGEVVDAVIAVLKGSYDSDTGVRTGGLPNTWFDEGDDGSEIPLRSLEHGDLSDYPVEGFFDSKCPAIIVRGTGTRPGAKGGTGGKLEIEEPVRIVHVRRFDQCRDAAGSTETNMSRARERYAKVIGSALGYDTHGKLAVIAADGTRTEVSLTCADTDGAQLIDTHWSGWDLGRGGPDGSEEVSLIRSIGQGARAWAIACDLIARVRVG